MRKGEIHEGQTPFGVILQDVALNGITASRRRGDTSSDFCAFCRFRTDIALSRPRHAVLQGLVTCDFGALAGRSGLDSRIRYVLAAFKTYATGAMAVLPLAVFQIKGDLCGADSPDGVAKS